MYKYQYKKIIAAIAVFTFILQIINYSGAKGLYVNLAPGYVTSEKPFNEARSRAVAFDRDMITLSLATYKGVVENGLGVDDVLPYLKTLPSWERLIKKELEINFVEPPSGDILTIRLKVGSVRISSSKKHKLNESGSIDDEKEIPQEHATLGDYIIQFFKNGSNKDIKDPHYPQHMIGFGPWLSYDALEIDDFSEVGGIYITERGGNFVCGIGEEVRQVREKDAIAIGAQEDKNPPELGRSYFIANMLDQAIPFINDLTRKNSDEEAIKLSRIVKGMIAKSKDKKIRVETASNLNANSANYGDRIVFNDKFLSFLFVRWLHPRVARYEKSGEIDDIASTMYALKEDERASLYSLWIYHHILILEAANKQKEIVSLLAGSAVSEGQRLFLLSRLYLHRIEKLKRENKTDEIKEIVEGLKSKEEEVLRKLLLQMFHVDELLLKGSLEFVIKDIPVEEFSNIIDLLENKSLNEELGAIQMLVERLFHEIAHEEEEVEQIRNDRLFYSFMRKGYKFLLDYVRIDVSYFYVKAGAAESSRRISKYYRTGAYFKMLAHLDALKNSDLTEEEYLQEEENIINDYLEKGYRQNSSREVVNLPEEKIIYAQMILAKKFGIQNDIFDENIFGISLARFLRRFYLFLDHPPGNAEDMAENRTQKELFGGKFYWRGLNLLTIPIIPVSEDGKVIWEVFRFDETYEITNPATSITTKVNAPPKGYYDANKISLYEYLSTHDIPYQHINTVTVLANGGLERLRELLSEHGIEDHLFGKEIFGKAFPEFFAEHHMFSGKFPANDLKIEKRRKDWVNWVYKGVSAKGSIAAILKISKLVGKEEETRERLRKIDLGDSSRGDSEIIKRKLYPFINWASIILFPQNYELRDITGPLELEPEEYGLLGLFEGFTTRSPLLFGEVAYKDYDLLTMPIFPVDDEGNIRWEIFQFNKKMTIKSYSSDRKGIKPFPREYYKAKKISMLDYLKTRGYKAVRQEEVSAVEQTYLFSEVSGDMMDHIIKNSPIVNSQTKKVDKQETPINRSSGLTPSIFSKEGSAFQSNMAEIHQLTKGVDISKTVDRVVHILVDRDIPSSAQENIMTQLSKRSREPHILEKIHFVDLKNINNYLRDNNCDVQNTVVFLSDPKKLERIEYDVNLLVVSRDEATDFVSIEGLVGIARSFLNRDWETFRKIYYLLTDEYPEDRWSLIKERWDDSLGFDVNEFAKNLVLYLVPVRILDINEQRRINDLDKKYVEASS